LGVILDKEQCCARFQELARLLAKDKHRFTKRRHREKLDALAERMRKKYGHGRRRAATVEGKILKRL